MLTEDCIALHHRPKIRLYPRSLRTMQTFWRRAAHFSTMPTEDRTARTCTWRPDLQATPVSVSIFMQLINKDPQILLLNALLKDIARRAVDAWYSERQYYSYVNPVYSSSTGHFTQVVWNASVQVGLGIGIVFKNPYYYRYVVADYSPPGNYLGQFATNVRNPASCNPSSVTTAPATTTRPPSTTTRTLTTTARGLTTTARPASTTTRTVTCASG